MRAEALQLKTMDDMALARISGASFFRIGLRHILPGVISTVLVSLPVGRLILTAATLSFLGIGIPPPARAWGLMVDEGRDFIAPAWWITVFPGTAIFLTVMAFNFLGDWIRDRTDPSLRQQLTT